MRRILEIEIECGDTTCYGEPGKPCPGMGVGAWGGKWYCHHFAHGGVHLIDKDGWLQRWPECIEAERKEKP